MIGGACRDVRPALGVYVLGAIEPAGRAKVDGHLATCAACREELAGLAGLPALLRRVPFAEVERLTQDDPGWPEADVEPTDSILAGLLQRAAGARRARRRHALAVAAAVAALALGGGAAAGLLGGQSVGGSASPAASSSPTGPAGQAWQTVTGADPRTGVTLTVRYRPTTWGTRMDVQVAGVRPGTVCGLQVTDAAGRRWTVGGWKVATGDWSTWYPATTSLTYGQLRGFSVTAGQKVIAKAAVG